MASLSPDPARSGTSAGAPPSLRAGAAAPPGTGEGAGPGPGETLPPGPGADARIGWSSRDAHHPNAVVLATDPFGLPEAGFLAEQILEAEADRRFDVVVCVLDRALIPEPLLASDIRFCRIDYGDALDAIPSSSMIPVATYLRLLMPAAFGADYHRMLYIDTDVWLRRPGLGMLLETDRLTHRIAMAPDLAAFGTDAVRAERAYDPYRAGLGLPSDHIYRNAGVMLMDIRAMAAAGDGPRILGYARRMGEKLRHHDQSAVNGAMGNGLGLLTVRWNLLQFPGLQDRAEALDAVLLHFASWPKPWDAVLDPYRASFRPEYQAYFAKRFPGYAQAAARRFGPGALARLSPWLTTPRQALRAWKRQRQVPYRCLVDPVAIDEAVFERLLADPAAL